MSTPELSADALRAHVDDAGRLAVKVTPGAKRTAVTEDAQGVRVFVRAAPDKGKANAAVRALLAERLGIARSCIRLIRGETARSKVFAIEE
ncbi:DUF167 domain-containing protein [Oceanibium sediminis]|uniref:DUF167 domain-containing protein n=1 Tax=Oceanibium sediminis TaxID=2026339 RepID=UPI000DD41C63|nr:DUF167 domain-containing protein [Oceanibium sediminis]